MTQGRHVCSTFTQGFLYMMLCKLGVSIKFVFAGCYRHVPRAIVGEALTQKATVCSSVVIHVQQLQSNAVITTSIYATPRL
jgi:hypothetical protein